MPFPHAADPRVAPVEDPAPDVADMLAKTLGDDRGVPLVIFRTMARHPRMMKRFNVLGGFFLTRGELPARERELVVLRVAWRSGCEYEWAQHVLIGRRAGLTDAEIARVAEPGAPWSAADAALLRAADEVLDHTDLSDATWAELAGRFTETQLVELVVLVGFYRMAAGFLNATGVQKEADLPGWPAGAESEEAK
ncbi:carboxymuconolactone decarboxylase family protein [Pseudonocardia sp. RS11V-5]|uniref:carboxymuconolactone decarboxylase family protein n=1 Tax=Pseudonocardia terrae TaxID=2905831 RepID=UPI001E63D008|nr:carboxymuconolactone decarboxylase family protein [Pseudonocardia terrae]MCE3550990.1 carboxymuconolactone decarboxylase family protein [Pseudonocardia terrae]